MVFKKGTKCIYTAGRRMGTEVEVVDVASNNKIKVKDAKGKERKVSPKHLEPSE